MQGLVPIFLFLFIVSLSCQRSFGLSSPSPSMPLLYFGKYGNRIAKCGLDSPEIFYWDVANVGLARLDDGKDCIQNWISY